MPSFLHRVFARCTLAADMEHHVRFLRNILENKNQNMNVINRKIDNFFTKRSCSKVLKISTARVVKNSRTINVKFDGVSKMHLFTQSCLLTSYKASGTAKPRIVFSSLPRVIARISTKRKVLGMVKKRISIDP